MNEFSYFFTCNCAFNITPFVQDLSKLGFAQFLEFELLNVFGFLGQSLFFFSLLWFRFGFLWRFFLSLLFLFFGFSSSTFLRFRLLFLFAASSFLL